jgi:hypothetical protein
VKEAHRAFAVPRVIRQEDRQPALSTDCRWIVDAGCGGSPDAWHRIVAPTTPNDQRAARQAWDNVRSGKEALSLRASVLIHLPLVNEEATLGREQLDRFAGPVVDRTVDATVAALEAAGLAPSELAGIFLVGGASRLPLAATTLHRRLGIAPILIEQPELVVAEGSFHAPPTDDPGVVVPKNLVNNGFRERGWVAG